MEETVNKIATEEEALQHASFELFNYIQLRNPHMTVIVNANGAEALEGYCVAKSPYNDPTD